MNEKQLKEYWQAYTDAWKLMKNWSQVTNRHIVEMMLRHDIGIMNRLFCLVIRQEIKRIRAGGTLLPEKEYQKAFTGAWKLFKQNCSPNESEIFWDKFVNEIVSFLNEFDNSEFIKNLLIHVTLEEVERIYKNNK